MGGESALCQSRRAQGWGWRHPVRLLCLLAFVAQLGTGAGGGGGGFDLKSNMNVPHPPNRRIAGPEKMHLTNWASCLLVWKMGTIPVAYGKPLAPCLAPVHNIGPLSPGGGRTEPFLESRGDGF